MAITVRHRWCMLKIRQAFHPDVDESVVQSFMRLDSTRDAFESLFQKEGTSKLFIHYQPGDNGETGEWSPETSEPELFISNGLTAQMDQRCCVFIRTDKPLDTAKQSDSSLLFIELTGDALRSIESTLLVGSKPMFEGCEDWGLASDEQKTEYIGEMEGFVDSIQEGLESLVAGVDLAPVPEHLQEPISVTSNFQKKVQKEPEIISDFEALLEGWIAEVQKELDDSENPRDSRDKKGPKGELIFWRTKMQQLTVLAEQFKRKDCDQVVSCLSSWTKNSSDPSKQKIMNQLRHFKDKGVLVTEKANEAKDNVKYLFTLERFIEPLYSGSATTILDTFPALMNSIKMIYTIARYYSSTERMANFFSLITDQIIRKCKEIITEGSDDVDSLWKMKPEELVKKMQTCLRMTEAYQREYDSTKQKLAATPKGKQFDFPVKKIFGDMDLFCRRVGKLINLFSTIDQFSSMSQSKLEGMGSLIQRFKIIVEDFMIKKHDLLDTQNQEFDRDFVEFNVKIGDLEAALQRFINQSFETITTIESSLVLLGKFQACFQRETLRADLDSKLNVIFQNYGIELEEVQQLYEQQKHEPPLPRNLPPVAGNIVWSRHLLKRIEEPMKQFELNPTVLESQSARKIIRTYNRLARTLVAFEYLWHQAWVQSIDQAKSGLEATLIIRHPDDGKLYVNLDTELLQLIREAKCLDRMGIDVPESAKIILFQEEKLKSYYSDLTWALAEYERIQNLVIPVTAIVLKPLFNDMEYKLRPGMITLTWTSMNIDAYKQNIHTGLRRLDELVTNINDLVEHRIEKNLKTISQTLLVDLPSDGSFTIQDFGKMQEKHIASEAARLQEKNLEVEHAVEDLAKLIQMYHFDSNHEQVSDEEVTKIKKHYNHFMYHSLLQCAKNSMNALKKRIHASSHGPSKHLADVVSLQKPFFEVDVRLESPDVTLSPSLDDIQVCITYAAQAILRSYLKIREWKVMILYPPEGVARRPLKLADLDVLPEEEYPAFYERITKDIEVVRACLLLTGCIQGIRVTVAEYLGSFGKFEWMWKRDKDSAYREFTKDKPTLAQYKSQLNGFTEYDYLIAGVNDVQNIGPLSLKTQLIKSSMTYECSQWKVTYSKNLHGEAKSMLDSLSEFFRVTINHLGRPVSDLDSLRFMMNMLKKIRERESGMKFVEISEVQDMYKMLESSLPEGFMEKDEMDKKSIMLTSWDRVLSLAEDRADELSRTQAGFKKGLIRDVKKLSGDVIEFRQAFERDGPKVPGIQPMEAVNRLKQFKEKMNIHERKYKLYTEGEDLFALPKTEYPELQKTIAEVKLLDQLFGLYTEVLETLEEWKLIPWQDVPDQMVFMTEKMENFSSRCSKMPKKLRNYEAYGDLKKQIEDFQVVLPLLQELAKPSIMDRHWDAVRTITNSDFEISADFKLVTLIDLNLVTVQEQIEEVTEGADKQLKIYQVLEEIREFWEEKEFSFKEWKGRGINVLAATGMVIEELDDAQMQVGTALTQRHVAPFREEAQALLLQLSEASDTLERWTKVQMSWCSLESVFTGGDIAKSLPMDAKRFAKVDKEWAKIMNKSSDVRLVIPCCENETLKTSLPTMYQELEKCQKALDGYLEAKRNKFPRFYFVSNPGLLTILSQGSDPLSMNDHYEKVFDALEFMDHNSSDKTIIEKMHGSGGAGHEVIPFVSPVKAVGNIEDWLSALLKRMQLTLKELTRTAAGQINAMGASDVSQLRPFVDRSIAQLALLGIQIMWTTDTQGALDVCRVKKNAMKECNSRQLAALTEMSGWCLQALGAKVNRKKIETLVTVHVHQRDVTKELTDLYRAKKISGSEGFDWSKQARFYWRDRGKDDASDQGAMVVGITDFDFDYQYEYMGAKERLVITPLTDKCYITLAQALGMYFGGAPAGPAGTGKTETVKDLGSTLAIFVVVTNCTDQQSHKDCAKIFKGLCQGGLWGCFDEFNRIRLPVLSVVAQQVLAIQNAKKATVKHFCFPGDPQNVLLLPVCAFFITMNPGYAGRQELPENLKALFRGVAMMVPNFQIIKKVKLCSVGYTEFELMSQKFFVLYNTCKQQLSAQRHYDWGLRNILSVLRTAGETKRKNLDKPEAFLLYRTLRDMNLSKLVAQDVPLFLSVLADLFPGTAPPPKGTYPEIEAELRKKVEGSGLIYHLDWTSKVIQLYETTRVRHGIMLVGPTGGGKSKIILNLRQTLEETDKIQYREQRFNPKAIRAPEMYGEVDASSGEWTTGVFAAIWAKCNNRNNAYTTWIVADGPVDAIWIEDLNTVLDDNKLLTLANGDRIPMTENVKIMFEVETLVNASPATVSRAGIIYVSDTDLDWTPTVKSWVSRERPDALQTVLTEIIDNYLGESTPVTPGICFDFINRNLKPCMAVSRVGATTGLCNLLEVLMQDYNANDPIVLEKLFLYALCWSIGGLLEPDDRVKFDAWLREIDRNGCMPVCKEHETIYEYYVSPDSSDWVLWRPPKWEYPSGDQLDFSNLLVPTMDSTRSLFLLTKLQSTRVSTLMLGGAGTAKTSTALMFFDTLDPHVILKKRVNFSSATTPRMAQDAVDEGLDKRQGKTYGPPNNKRMTIFMDDVSMPEVNNWGDQPTLELIRLLVEQGGFMFLDRDKRGEKKTCDDLQYIAAMQHPGGGKNDIPNRLKRNFFIFNLVLPSIISINDIYGQMLGGRFPLNEFAADAQSVLKSLTKATIELWRTCKDKLLPTPAKFHYIFNMRELSRVFQGVLSCGTDILLTGGSYGSALGIGSSSIIVGLWKHECDRVFCDKLTNYKDKEWFAKTMEKLLAEQFDEATTADLPDNFFMVNFLRKDVKDEETDEIIEKAPKVYEPGGSLETLRPIVLEFLDRYNEAFPAKQMSLVLFDDALSHLLRLNRLLEMPRGSALLVGVGGSGKQSLTKLAAFVSRAELFQITLTKTYNMASLMDDLRFLFQSAGHQRKQTVFLFTESEIKQEVFLEVINSVLMTGEVPGLFAKDERLGMTSDLQPFFVKERPGMEESQDNLWQYFTDLVRDNLHLVLCMSPLNPMFPVRARKFPGLISGPTVDWFLSWPADALVAVSRGFIKDFPVECDAECKVGLMDHMGAVHSIVVEVCDEYFTQYRRAVSQTPKSYLSFISSYKDMYTKKLEEIKDKEKRVNLGLEKLIKGAEDVEQMKILLAEEDIKLQKATEETNVMLVELQKNAAEAQTESAKVLEIKTKCESDAIRIAAEKSDCEQDLARCQPIVDAALKAVDSIKPADINEVKKLPNPADIIKLIFDVVLILFKYPLGTVHAHELSFSSGKIIKPFLEPSFKPQAQALLNDSAFLNYVKEFSSTGKDVINEETIELMQPYLHLEEYNAKIAKGASNAAEGLCVWSRAMNDYHEASKIVKPKLEALAIAQAQMDAANAALAAAEKRLAACQALLDDLQAKFDAQMAEKKKIEDGAAMLQRKSTQATQLIEGLSGERIRWTEDSKTFESIKMRLVGDCAVSCAFVSYCGPFNQDFRSYLCDKFTKDCISKEVPVTKKLDVTDFLVDIGTIGDWNMEGLPTDPLSIQNGILVTRSSRYPMLIDPQGQALGWIRRREAERMPHWGTVLINDAKLKDKLEFAMGNDNAFVVVGVENTVDPMLDPLLEKEIVVKGRRKMITISDKQMDFTDGFMLYFITRLPNPSFSPELQAKTTIVDFTVTQKGLEEQLLGIVISKEQKALEEQLSEVLEEVNSSTKMLLDLDKSLLDRLTSGTGNLLDDEELVGVLNNTKQKAADVKIKLTAAADTKKSINEKREQFRPVATRGSVLYFAIVEMSLVNPMYQTALAQFLGLFNASMNRAEKASLASKRVGNIIETMTRIVYRYINRGLYEADKLAFLLIVTLKILITAGLLKTSDITLLLRGGASLDMSTAKRKPFNWLSNEAWLNVCALSQGRSFFANLKEEMSANEVGWRNWFEDNEPEARAIPDYESKLAETADIGPFFKLLLVRSLRMDRAILTAKEFIRETPVMGQYYVDPVTDTTEMLYEEMVADTPVIFLLSRGADPTESIEALAKKRKFPPPAVISLGEGQDVIAKKQLEVAAKEGTWVLLQNCELMLDLMDEMEQIIAKFKETYLDSNFRLFITALPHPEFPLGLLQMSTKVTNEPPAGLKAGVLRSYTVLVDQDRLERVDGPRGKMWRQLLFALCFLHSTVQERRKFGSIGWCIPYEYSTGDITACIVFLERHLYSGEISWDTFQYMVADVQYGGKITDDLDRRLFQTYAKIWLNLNTCEEGHSFSPAQPILRLPSDFQYTVPSGMEIKEYKDYISGFPEIDSPEIFGLHPNADLTFRNNEVGALIRTLGETQPKGSGGGGGVSREEVVLNKASELLERLPEDFIEDDYKAKLNKFGGLDKPLNIFLFQEIQRLQKVIGKVRFILEQLQLAINGEVVMTDELQQTLDAMFEAKVPHLWTYAVSGDEFSWILPTLGLWFTALLSRDGQNRKWLEGGRPDSFWLTGFFNPNGFLTAMKQEVVRKHKAEKWSLDDVVDRTEVTTFETPAKIKEPITEGVYVHGLFIEGAGFDRAAGLIIESEPKKLYVQMPVLFVSANAKKNQEALRKEQFGSLGPFDCPVYKYPKRTDRFYIFIVTLKCPDNSKGPAHWVLRAAALLCNCD